MDSCDVIPFFFFSGSRSHYPHVGCDEYEAAKLEANLRPSCVARNKVRYLRSGTVSCILICFWLTWTSSRSPLNVVRVGLDILRSELTRPNSTTKIDPATLELLEDIISSSDTSIDILNELLDYEHMDAGIQWSTCVTCYILTVYKITSWPIHDLTYSHREFQTGDEMAPTA